MADAPEPTPDRLLSARWVLPMTADGVLEAHSVALAGSRIVAVLPTAEARRQWPSLPEERFDRHVLLPGLVNAHGHAAMALFRGFADDMLLQPWLEERIWPLEGRWVDAEFVADGTELAIAEMLASGTTTFSDMYFFPEATAAVAHRCGVRAQLCGPVVRFANGWSASGDDAIHRTLALHDEYAGSDRIDIAFGPHSTYATDFAHLERIATLAAELDLGVQIHLHETAEEVATAVAETGERPLDRVARADLLGPRLQAVHMTQVEPDDYALLARHDVTVVHCPRSNLKLASGFAPVAALRAAGVRVALGTDGAASNNSLSLFREMHVTALVAKAVAGDPAALPALEVLRMGTLEGAVALGRGDDIGSLEPGKSADLVAVDMSGLEMAPVFHPESQLVYANAGSNVCDVWVAGERLLREGAFTRMDRDAVVETANRWRDRILEAV